MTSRTIHSSRCQCGWFKKQVDRLCKRCSVLLKDPVMIVQPDPGKYVHLPVKRYKNRLLTGPELPLRWLSMCGQQGFLYFNAPVLEDRKVCRACKSSTISVRL